MFQPSAAALRVGRDLNFSSRWHSGRARAVWAVRPPLPALTVDPGRRAIPGPERDCQPAARAGQSGLATSATGGLSAHQARPPIALSLARRGRSRPREAPADLPSTPTHRALLSVDHRIRRRRSRPAGGWAMGPGPHCGSWPWGDRLSGQRELARSEVAWVASGRYVVDVGPIGLNGRARRSR